MTDLTRIWSESADRKTILKRSFDEDTAIDPSEDAEQMRVFLQKIEAGLRGDEGTALSIEHDPKRSMTDMPCMNLQVTVNLTKPLPPLKWPIFLCPESPSSFTEKVVMPLLEAQNARISETESLQEILKEKDHIIQKLVDKLDAAGSDLGHIFPIIALKGKKNHTRAHAEVKLKGLEVFDKPTWKKTLIGDRRIGDMRLLAAAAFGRTNDCEVEIHEGNNLPRQWDTWWDNLEGSSSITSQDAETAAASLSIETPNENEVTLQVRSTPPRNSQTSNKQSSATLGNSNDTESDDLDSPSQPSAIPDSFPTSTPPKTGKIGGIGGLKGKRTRPQKPEADVKSIDDTASEDENRNSPPPARQKVISSPNPKSRGLGMIGRRRGSPTPPPVKRGSDSEQDLGEAEGSRPEKRRKLGALGRDAHSSSNASRPGEKKKKSKSPVAEYDVGSGLRETSEERILRKREEIQKELLGKAQKPIKKKRKF